MRCLNLDDGSEQPDGQLGHLLHAGLGYEPPTNPPYQHGPTPAPSFEAELLIRPNTWQTLVV